MKYRPYRNEETRSSVLRGVTGEEQAGWGRFFDTYAGYIFGIARKRGLAAEDADEVVQSVMQELCHGQALKRYERGKGSFRSWLGRLAAWRTANFAEKQAGERRVESMPPSRLDELADPSPTELERAFEEEWAAAVGCEALRRLKEETNARHFEIYHASAVEELGTEEILRLYGISADNLYQIRRRVGGRFRELLERVKREMEEPGE